MRIARIAIENFRNFRAIDLPIGDHAVIVGENKVGKSNLVHALRLVLDPTLPDASRQLRVEDFWDGLKDRPLTRGDRIVALVELADFEGNDDHLALLAEFLVRPEPMVARLTYVFQPLGTLAGEPSGDADYEFLVYGGDRPDCRVGHEVRRRLPLDLMPALRDAEGDLVNWRRSPLRPLLDRAAGQIDAARLKELCVGVMAASQAVAGCDEVKAVADRIGRKLVEMVGSSHALETALGFSPTDGERLIRSLRMFIDNGVRSVADASLGSANLLYLALKALEIEQQVADNVRSHTFLAIEEPEAHLHPHVQRQVFRTFLRPRQPQPGAVPADPGTTVVLTTHSPNVVSVTPAKSFVLLKRADDRKSTVGVSTAGLDLTTEETADIERYLDVTRGELLFARGVLLVEGEAEEYLVPVLARLNGYNLDELGVSICSVGGTHFLPYLKFLGPGGLDIPCAVLTDTNPKNDGTSYGLPRLKKLLVQLAGAEGVAGLDAEELLNLGRTHGVFLTDHTFEVALFRASRQTTFSQTMEDVSSSAKAKERAEAWKVAPATLDVAKMLSDIERVGKGRFAQRWAHWIGRNTSKACPASVTEALAYVSQRIG